MHQGRIAPISREFCIQIFKGLSHHIQFQDILIYLHRGLRRIICMILAMSVCIYITFITKDALLLQPRLRPTQHYNLMVLGLLEYVTFIYAPLMPRTAVDRGRVIVLTVSDGSSLPLESVLGWDWILLRPYFESSSSGGEYWGERGE